MNPPMGHAAALGHTMDRAMGRTPLRVHGAVRRVPPSPHPTCGVIWGPVGLFWAIAAMGTWGAAQQHGKASAPVTHRAGGGRYVGGGGTVWGTGGESGGKRGTFGGNAGDVGQYGANVGNLGHLGAIFGELIGGV